MLAILGSKENLASKYHYRQKAPFPFHCGMFFSVTFTLQKCELKSISRYCYAG